MPGRADHDGFAMLGAERRDAGRCAVRTEIHDHVGSRDKRCQIVALVDLAGELQFGMLGKTGQKHFAHSAFGTGDDYTCHRFLTTITQSRPALTLTLSPQEGDVRCRCTILCEWRRLNCKSLFRRCVPLATSTRRKT